MPDLLRRILAVLRPRNAMRLDAPPAFSRPRSGALAEVEQAVVASNAAEVERAEEREVPTRPRPPGGGG